MQNDRTNAEEDGRRLDGGDGGTAETAAVVQIVIVPQQPPPPPEAEAVVAVSVNSAVKAGALDGAVSEKDEKAKKICLSRSESYNEQCRICQQQSEENLVDLGCRCRGELAKAHRSCIGIWFRTRGSNRCEICQQVAVNIPFPESQPSTNYWVWRIDPAFRGPNIGRGQQERGCFSPLWVAFSILIGGLLLDVLISVSLGVSALPVNIIIGVLIVLGLGTALRLALECCHEWSLRRGTERAEITVNPGYHPAV